MTVPVPSSFDLVTFDAPDTGACASFWCSALDLVELEREDIDRWLVLGTSDGRRVLGIQRGPTRPGSVHLDLQCPLDEFDAELARLSTLGATPFGVTRREPYGSIANLADPDGNPFDLCAYTTEPLRGEAARANPGGLGPLDANRAAGAARLRA